MIEEKEEKSKIKNIQYNKFKVQPYLTSNLFSNYEVEVLSKLRSRNIDVKSNFKTKYKINNVLDLKCPLFNCYDTDDQQILF